MKLSKTKKSPSNWNDLLGFDTLNEEDLHEAQMLMFNFLSEIEKYQDLKCINRKKLAEKIKTSPSYLTQIFRGDKPLNFYTIAKMQRVLNIKFNIKATQYAKQLPQLTSSMPEIVFSSEALYIQDIGNKHTLLHKHQWILIKGENQYERNINKDPSYSQILEENSNSTVLINS